MKKAAMFGLCRALKKQAGGLFLVSRHSEAPQGANGSFKTNRAAMFGLDARIALAIFGALSVISGAALYSAIGNAKATALLTEMNEVGKAWEQYLLDTGVSPVRHNSSNSSIYFYMLKAKHLVENPGVTGWKGPYLSNEPTSDAFLKSREKENIGFSIITLVGENTFGGVNNWPSGTCTSGKQCYLWVASSENEDDSVAKIIDGMVDGSDGSDSGNFRWHNEGGVAKYNYFYKYAPIANPND